MGELGLEGGLRISQSDEARAAELAARIERHRAAYYGGAPEISDAAFDALEDELRALDPTHTVLAKVGSAELATEWEKARHEIPMGSLNKVTNEEELRAWVARCDELLPAQQRGGESVGQALFVTEKLDGISIEVIYDRGRFVDAITRGDGDVGERISPNVARMRGVPRRVAHEGRLAFRGEIILRKSDARNFPDVMSLRNQAAGTSKRLDGQGTQHLTVLFYDVPEEVGVATETEKLAFLRRLKLPTPPFRRATLDEALAIYASYGERVRGELDYEIDGLVVKVDSLAAQTLLGELNRRPRGAVAFKFPSPAKISRVREILWDTGPSGRVTPVAVVEPVELAGAMVQRASLHNAANVRGLGIGVGDEVLVSRRNDVIPYVEEVVASAGSPAAVPERCPVCSSRLEILGEYLMCRNAGCPALVKGRISNWIGAIGALEWGDKLIEQLVEAGLVREPADLYRLQWEDIAKLERRGEKIAKKCLAELTSRLPLSLPTFLAALGIEGFAEQTARLLVSAGYGDVDALLAATEEELTKIPGLGPIKAANVVRGLAARREEIARLRAAGVDPVTTAASGPLAGKTFCFTGSADVPRAELVRLVERAGGRVLGSVTKELNYLVLGDPASASTKAQKARQLGTELLSYEQFHALVGG